MHLSIINVTNEVIRCSWESKCLGTSGSLRNENAIIFPSRPTAIVLNRKRTPKILLALSRGKEKEAEGVSVMLNETLRASWTVLPVSRDCRWRLFLTLNSKHYRLVILPKRDLVGFMSELPDESTLSSLLLPGTHDTMAFYGWPISQCQYIEDSLPAQLRSGIRVIDVRLGIVDGRLLAYHGIYPQKTPFQTILANLQTFLSFEPSRRETVIMSIMQEDAVINPPKEFSRLVREEMLGGIFPKDLFFLENRVPSLGEVRGKIVLLSRFGDNGEGWQGGMEGLGIHPTRWPNSVKEGFTWYCKDTLVRTHDWYAIPSFLAIPEKVMLATELLLSSSDEKADSTLNISFFSAANFPLAAPPMIAQGFGWPRWGLGVEGVNSRVGSWLLDLLSSENTPRLQGWTLMDFFSTPNDGLPPLLVEFNFRR